MLCKDSEELPNSDNYIYQVKLDGQRATQNYKNKTTIKSRRGKVITYRFPELDTEENIEAKLDGEIVVFNEKGNTDFSKLAKRSHLDNTFKIRIRKKKIPVKYIVFDILSYQGQDTTKKPLEKRNELLNKVIEEIDNENIQKAKTYENGEKLLEKTKQEGKEGIIAKKEGSKYYHERSDNWKKIKNKQEKKLEIKNYKKSDKQDRVIRNIKTELGEVGSGLSQQQQTTIKNRIDRGETIQAEIEFLNLTKDGKMRQPTLKRII